MIPDDPKAAKVLRPWCKETGGKSYAGPKRSTIGCPAMGSNRQRGKYIYIFYECNHNIIQIEFWSIQGSVHA